MLIFRSIISYNKWKHGIKVIDQFAFCLSVCCFPKWILIFYSLLKCILSMLLLHVVIMSKPRRTKLFGKCLVHLWDIYFCISIKFFNYIDSFHASLTCGENEQTRAQKMMLKASSLSLRNATTVYLFLSHRFFYSCMWCGWTNTWTGHGIEGGGRSWKHICLLW